MSRADREKWDTIYRTEGARRSPAPSDFLLAVLPLLPRRGTALDIAGGAGRHALALARHGLDVLLADGSEEGLALARAAAQEAGLPLRTVRYDADEGPPPPGPFDVVLCRHFLRRELFPLFPDLLHPGGWLVFEQPTRKDLAAHPSGHYLLEEGELARLVQGLDVVRLEERWVPAGRHEACLLARKPGSA